MSDVVIPPDALDRQRAASDPTTSAWVSANAGAGKTKVLTDRVIRLMLAGSAPSRILCLTFTKAAAAEMTIRVFETLGDWVTLDDPKLSQKLTELTGERPKPATLARARRLFARAVETPGGLKIETIHAFCERLLHLVPFEADVPARFAVLDDGQAADVMTEARGAILSEAAGTPGLAEALDTVTAEVAGDALVSLLAAAVADPGLPCETDELRDASARLRAILEIDEGDTTEALCRAVVKGGYPSAEWGALADALEHAGGVNNAKRASALRAAAESARRFSPLIGTDDGRHRAGSESLTGDRKLSLPHAEVAADGGPRSTQDRRASFEARLRRAPQDEEGGSFRSGFEDDEVVSFGSVIEAAELYQAVFFTSDGKPLKSLATKAVPERVRGVLAAEQARIVVLRERMRAVDTVARTEALWRLAAAIRARYEAAKRRLGALDFADLIARTLRLLESGAASWVLFRLDRGIDHVLVDEAQDTNADQWRILRRLTEDFTAGSGRPTQAVRTVFAVGDPKQSIYSFQGADPRLFEASRRHWLGLHRTAEMRFADIRLLLSFRSAPVVLKGVDDTFGLPAHLKGLTFDERVTRTTHQSARIRAPGRIEIWPTEKPAEKLPDPDAWSLPLDQPDPTSPALVAARRVAAAVRHWTMQDDPRLGRAWKPGEILILARRRGPAFFACIRALKAAGVPVAGADRIDINAQIAVQDLIAAGQAAVLRGNDLALACALKSPLVGLTDDDLVRIAADRPDGSSLADALEEAAASDPRARDAAGIVQGWREAARIDGPFAFYARLLGPGGGRRRLAGRLGGEALDAIDTFLCRAQAEEGKLEAPSLPAFLSRFEAAEHVIKRDPEGRSDEVRVMTVHGAKGLEAPLVILLDGCEVLGRDPRLLDASPGEDEPRLPVWSPRKDDDPPAIAKARDRWRERAMEEHNRLLYVALTRARDRLVIVPFTDGNGKEPPEAWSQMVQAAFASSGTILVNEDLPYGPVMAVSEGKTEPVSEAAARPASDHALPEWLFRHLPPEETVTPPLRPSAALVAADAPSRRTEAAERARRTGILVHALLAYLGHLPAAGREEAAATFLEARASTLPEAERRAMARSILNLMNHPDLAAVFGPGSVAEVPVAGTIGPPGRERPVSGQIDRVAIGDGLVTLAEFKTGAAPRDGRAPPSYLAQLAVYVALLRDAYPGHAVRALLVWPEGPTIVAPPRDALDAALAGISEPAPVP